jgi:plastocyanin
MMKRIVRFGARWFVPAVVLAVVGPASAATTGGQSPSPSIYIKDFRYAPPTVRVHVPDTVHLVNDDSDAQTVTAEDKSFDSEGLDTGNAWDHTFTKAGTYRYFCAVHPYMTGASRS